MNKGEVLEEAKCEDKRNELEKFVKKVVVRTNDYGKTVVYVQERTAVLRRLKLELEYVLIKKINPKDTPHIKLSRINIQEGYKPIPEK